MGSFYFHLSLPSWTSSVYKQYMFSVPTLWGYSVKYQAGGFIWGNLSQCSFGAPFFRLFFPSEICTLLKLTMYFASSPWQCCVLVDKFAHSFRALSPTRLSTGNVKITNSYHSPSANPQTMPYLNSVDGVIDFIQRFYTPQYFDGFNWKRSTQVFGRKANIWSTPYLDPTRIILTCLSILYTKWYKVLITRWKC